MYMARRVSYADIPVGIVDTHTYTRTYIRIGEWVACRDWNTVLLAVRSGRIGRPRISGSGVGRARREIRERSERETSGDIWEMGGEGDRESSES